MDAPWRIELLGGLRCTRGARVISRFRSQNIAFLLAYLALHRERRHSREELADLLWPNEPGKVPRANLRVALASLRRQLEPPDVPAGSVIVAHGRTHVGLNPVTVRVDVAEFDRALYESRRAERTPGDQAALLEEAVRLYGGPLLPGFDAAWADDERARLAEAYREALRRLAAHGERAGDWGAALDSARRAVAADPFDEDAHADLIRLLAVAGQPHAALRQYETLKRVLEEECGDVPSAAVRVLAEQIEKDAGLPLATLPPSPPLVFPAAPAPPLPAAAARPLATRLPLQFTRFFGREAEIKTIGDWLRPGTSFIRLLTLTGLGGSGKTRLAIEAAACLAPLFENRVFFAPLADVADAGRIADAVLDALGTDRQPGVCAMDQVIEVFATAPPSLLVLDNFEHLADAGAALLLADLLRRAPNLFCLVTSRQRLLLEAEHELPVPLLPTPTIPEGAPERLMDFAAVALFVDRAQHARPDFQITPRNARAVAELCARLEGLPLSLLLAAAWAQTLTPAQMLAHLDRRLDLLVSRRRDLPPRHRSLRAALDGSWQLLPSDLQTFLARLSVFRGGWTVEAAEAVCEEPAALDFTAQLRERSLLTAEEYPGADSALRFRMLETVREFAQEQLSPQEWATRTHRHAGYFTALTEEAYRQFDTPDAQQRLLWLARMERENDNIRAALSWGLEHEPETALRIVAAWFAPEQMAERGAAAERALDRAAERGAQTGAGAVSPELLSNVLGVAADYAGQRSDFARQKERAQQRLSLMRSLGNPFHTAWALHALGSNARALGSWEAAAAYYRDSLALFRQHQAGQPVGWLLTCLGCVLAEKGDLAPASASFEEAATVFARNGDKDGVAGALAEQADVVRQQGDLETARRIFEEVTAIEQTLGDSRSHPRRRYQRGWLAAAEGDYVAARERFKEALRGFGGNSEKSGLLLSLLAFACLAGREGRWPRAARLFGAVDTLRETLGTLLPPSDEAEFNGASSRARAILGAEDFARAWTLGRVMTKNEAIAEALQSSEDATEA